MKGHSDTGVRPGWKVVGGIGFGPWEVRGLGKRRETFPKSLVSKGDENGCLPFDQILETSESE